MLVGATTVLLAPVANAGPDECVLNEDGNIATCTGDQSSGIASGIDFDTPPVSTLNVHDLDTGITTQGQAAISFINNTGSSVNLNSGNEQNTVDITTSGDNASGIVARSRGESVGFTENTFLGIKIPIDEAGGLAGGVRVESYSNITTNGVGSHGIEASNRVGSYDQAVVDSLTSFSADAITQTVASVDGSADNLGVLVNGSNGGIFRLKPDGQFLFDYGKDFRKLGIGETIETEISYQVLQESPDGSHMLDGNVSVTVTRDESGRLKIVPPIVFDFPEYPGYTQFAEPSEDFPLIPDLQGYVDGLLGNAGVGGVGESIDVLNAGNIVTYGSSSHGIFAQTESGAGASGRNGGGFWSFGSRAPTAGSRGENGGGITIVNEGSIETWGNESGGIVALSIGGTGGRGGNGGFYYYGRRGGQGGDAGNVRIEGGGTIITHGDSASGILAISEGGIGGNGGSGGTVGGGNGGYGGNAGSVTVEGDFNVTTYGVDSHAIWAKSIGGSGGVGGTGGWFAGGGGGGGASDGGDATIISAGAIQTYGSDSYGLYAQSVGGFGGDGGSASSLFVAYGGSGTSAGSGGLVTVTNQSTGSIMTEGDRAHAILAQSIGGGGGSGGSAGAIVGLGGASAAGGNGGDVVVTNQGYIQTSGNSARGVYAQSVGGGGGDGGNSGGLVAIGGNGSETSDGGDVSVTNLGNIVTQGNDSHAIFAESIGGGGGDGGRSGGLVSIGGDGGGGGDAGAVDITNSSNLSTSGSDASAIFAQSIGGGGGNGGGSVSVSTSIASVSIGGDGGVGGDGDSVTVLSTDTSNLSTTGDRSYGIFAQSVGGGGGNGGFAISTGTATTLLSLAIGGDGGAAGNGSEVFVGADGNIVTGGAQAHGIFAQSVGGGGGNGGYSVAGNMGGGLNVNLSMGGRGGAGGVGSTVNIGAEDTAVLADITTYGERAYGILAQSLGGGGGDGGFSITGSGVTLAPLNFAFGGSGGAGNTGGAVNIYSAGNITTYGNDAHAVFAQSLGGGGGNGGFSLAGSYGGLTPMNFSFGGDGGVGGSSSAVTVGTELNPLAGDITTFGDRAHGVVAQSIGGGGGDGGVTVAASLLGAQAVEFSFGGDGGEGGTGGNVNVDSEANIYIEGDQSYGIMAQSIGGGGGSGGFSLDAAVTAFGGFSFSMGGDGGAGNSAGTVDVDNSGDIITLGEYSHGVFAQSVGGGGGVGGSSGSAMVNFSSLIPVPPEIPITGSVNFAISLGGDGGDGGVADRVDVTNTGRIITQGDYAYGIFSQSIGGGGGAGGKSVAATANISAPIPSDPTEPQLEVQLDFALAIGGDGGSGNHGGEVIVNNDGLIDTVGDGAHGIVAQSVGGGGGIGGDARSMTLSIDPGNWSPEPIVDPGELTSVSAAANISIGGSGGSGGDGSTVTVNNNGDIVTRGADAYGIFAQSIGGGGGDGGGGYHGLDWSDLGVPDDLLPFFELVPAETDSDLQIVVGGQGGSSGNGDSINVTNVGSITTLGNGSFGVLAQSIGGGGGTGGIGALGNGTVGLGGGGGTAGNGGAVDIAIEGGIETYGIAAHAILAQSIGGGGGIAGNVDHGVNYFDINEAMSSLAIALEGGNAGDGGVVTVNSAGDIITHGEAASGIFAQSIGGGGGLAGDIGTGIGFAGSAGGDGAGSDVNITHDGNIIVYGANADGIFAQSTGGSGSGNITIDVSGGTILGGSGTGVGVHFAEGADNTLTNDGIVTALSGNAIIGDSGNETIDNYGTIGGSVELGGGVNTFNNYEPAVLNSGSAVDLGAGNSLTNAGTLSPGGQGNIQTTILTGNLNQTSTGTFEAEISGGGEHDRLLVYNGMVSLEGALVVLRDQYHYIDGTTYDILEIENQPNGITYGLSDVILPDSTPLLSFNLDQQPNQLVVEAHVASFTTVSTSSRESAIASYLDNMMLTASDDMSRVLGEFQSLSSAPEFRTAFTSLSPAQYDSSTTTTYAVTEQYSRTLLERMHSVRALLGLKNSTEEAWPLLAYNGSDKSQQLLLSPQESEKQNPYGLWFDGFKLWGDQGGQNGFVAYDYSVYGMTLGFDRNFGDGFMAGISLGLTKTNIDIHYNLGEGDIESNFVSLYGSYFTEKMYFDLVLSYGKQDFDNYRNVTVGSLQRVARSGHNGDSYSMFVEGGYNFDYEPWILQPFASLMYTSLAEDGFTEQGAGAANQIVADRDTESLVSELGLRVTKAYQLENGTLLPEASLAWNYNFDIGDRLITASYEGSPNTTFSIDGQDVEKHGASVGVGLMFISKGGLSTALRYRGEFRDKYDAQAVYGEMRYEF